jgi:hypothetical protein
MEKISWSDRVRNEEVLCRLKDRNILHAIKTRKASWNCHIWRRNCLLKHIIEPKIEGRIEVTGRQGRSHKQLAGDLKGNGWYWKLKEKTLDLSLWRNRFGRGHGPAVRQITEWMTRALKPARHGRTGHASTGNARLLLLELPPKCSLYSFTCVQTLLHPALSNKQGVSLPAEVTERMCYVMSDWILLDIICW